MTFQMQPADVIDPKLKKQPQKIAKTNNFLLSENKTSS